MLGDAGLVCTPVRTPRQLMLMELFPHLLPMAPLGAAALLLTTAALATAPLSAAERLERIPPAFRGIWMAEPRHCTAKATDESWLRIEADRITFYESTGPVLAVVGSGRNEIGLITELSGEGSTWLHLLRLRLDSTGNRLALEAVGLEGASARVRCPDR
jgi:hypothetical protein